MTNERREAWAERFGNLASEVRASALELALEIGGTVPQDVQAITFALNEGERLARGLGDFANRIHHNNWKPTAVYRTRAGGPLTVENES